MTKGSDVPSQAPSARLIALWLPCWLEGVSTLDRAGVRAGPEDVGDQTLIRGLDTAFPFVRPGLSLSNTGVDLTIGHIVPNGSSPAVARPRCCTIDVRCCSGAIGLLLRVRAEGSWAGRAAHSSIGP
jgi:hypothetical protein